MKLSEKKSGNFAPCPEYTGRAVCVDVTPPETKQTEYGPKEKFRLTFEIDLLDQSTKPARPHCVWSSGFTTSLNEKASFRKFLRQWFGRDLTAQELEEFDTEALIGKPAFVVITHSQGDNGETYANITACTPHKVGEPLAPSGTFTRKKDRDAKKAGGGGDSAQGEGASYRKAAQPVAEDGGTVGRENWMRTKVHVGKHAGVDLGDLDPEAIEKLIANWLPVHAKNAKPKADDKRLAEALGFAQAALAEAAATPPAPAADTY
jgi:hypothetical protein